MIEPEVVSVLEEYKRIKKDITHCLFHYCKNELVESINTTQEFYDSNPCDDLLLKNRKQMPIKTEDKTYFKDNVKYQEYYENGKLNMYTTTEKVKELKTTKEFDYAGGLICETRIHYNINGIPVKVEQWLIENEKVNYDLRIIPVFPEYIDIKTMTELDKHTHSELINTYLLNNKKLSC